MLTPEQIKDFEARAEAGEKPVMEWDHCKESATAMIGDTGEMMLVSCRNGEPDEFWGNMIGGSKERIRMTRAAAILASEAAFRELTRPMWGKELAELQAEHTAFLEALKAMVAEVEWGATIQGSEGHMRKVTDEARAIIDAAMKKEE